jgi:hypothetical protein
MGAFLCPINFILGTKLRAEGGTIWLDNEFGWKERAAQNFMSAADAFGKYAPRADLSFDAHALYLLSGPAVYGRSAFLRRYTARCGI